MGTLDNYLGEFREYRQARKHLLVCIGIPDSQRDPLSEFAERVSEILLGGRLCESRVQAGYDLIRERGAKVQVKYLANPKGKWRNEHAVRIIGCDEYALVFFEDLDPRKLIVFKEPLSRVCAFLKKRHQDQETTLQVTQRNFESIISDRDAATGFGLEVYDLER